MRLDTIDDPQAVERHPVETIIADDIATVRIRNGYIYFSLFVNEVGPDGGPMPTVIAKIRFPVTIVPAAIHRTVCAMVRAGLEHLTVSLGGRLH